MGVTLAAAGGRYDVGQNAEINVTPFVDVMLVLLIIFMVAAPLATVNVKLDLPKASFQHQTQPPTTVYISLQKNGKLWIGDFPTNLDRLGADVKKAVGTRNPDNERIYVRADADVPYENFIRVMNKLQDNGFYSVALMSEELKT
ncbi:biopolymer transporter ExbD [soil metagenome]